MCVSMAFVEYLRLRFAVGKCCFCLRSCHRIKMEEKKMYCTKCGKEIDDNVAVCPNCGCKTENPVVSGESNVVPAESNAGKALGIVAIVLGALSLAWAWLIAIFGWILSVPGLILALVGRSKNKGSKVCKVGLILSSIGLGCSLINSVLGIILAAL